MNIYFKPNVIVVWTHTNIEIADGFCQACTEVYPGYIPTLTSGSDGIHSDQSGHYYGRALDFRSHDLPNDGNLIWQIKERWEELLGVNYLCILEGDHFHLQRQKNSF